MIGILRGIEASSPLYPTPWQKWICHSLVSENQKSLSSVNSIGFSPLSFNCVHFGVKFVLNLYSKSNRSTQYVSVKNTQAEINLLVKNHFPNQMVFLMNLAQLCPYKWIATYLMCGIPLLGRNKLSIA